MLGTVNMLAAACSGAATRPPYHWHKGAMDGGGYCNAIATDPLQPGHAAAAGDVWGEFATDTAGALWYPTMIGATSTGSIYGRAVAYSTRVPGRGTSASACSGRSAPARAIWARSPRGRCASSAGTRTSRFSTDLPDGSAHDVPRAVGNLIAVDYDAALRGASTSTSSLARA